MTGTCGGQSKSLGAVLVAMLLIGAAGVCVASTLSPGSAQDSSGREEVKYSADRIIYSVSEDLLTLSGHSRVAYKDLVVEAETVKFDSRAELLRAYGSPILREGSHEIRGRSMAYSLKSGKGEIRQGRTMFEKGFYTGERIVRVTPNEFNVHRADFTTCNREHPHYHFWSYRMKIFSNDKVIAEPVILLVQDVPVLMLPFWVFPIKTGRHTGILMPRVGQSAYEGRFIKNITYFQVLSDYSDATLTLDYMERVGWRASLEGRYFYSPKLETQVNGTYFQDHQAQHRRWNAILSHRQTLSPRFDLTLNGDFVSDATYYQQFGDDQYRLLERSLHSYLSLNRSWQTSSASLVLDQNRNLDSDTRTEILPRFTYSLFRRRLFGNVYGSLRSYSANSRVRSAGGDERHQGSDNAVSISTSSRAFGWLNLSPVLNYRETWYDRDRQNTHLVRRGLYDASLGANLTLYGHPLLPGLQNFRHVLTPGLSYSYRPDIDQSRFFAFAGIGNYGGVHQASASLHNGFQWKRETETGSTRIDLANLDFSTGYDLRAETRPLSPLTSSFAVLPLQRWAQIRLTSVHDLYQRKLENLSLSTGLQFSGQNMPVPSRPDTLEQADTAATQSQVSPAGPWRVSVNHSYLRGSTGASSQQLWGRIEFNLTRNWRIDYSQRYDFSRQEGVSRDVMVYRDLHCWEARLHWWSIGSRWWYEFKLGIKALPDIKFERRESSL